MLNHLSRSKKRRVVLDIETDSIDAVKNIWCVVCADIDSGELFTFHDGMSITHRLPTFIKEECKTVVGHNLIQYDIPWLLRFVPSISFDHLNIIDTLVLSRQWHFKLQGGHSLDAWGTRLNLKKGEFNDFSKYTQEMLDYCIRDVELNVKLFKFFEERLNDPVWERSVRLEHDIAKVCKDMHANGFEFDIAGAKKLRNKLDERLKELDVALQEGFPPVPTPVRVVTPKETKFGTLSKVGFQWVTDGDLSPFTAGASFTLFEWVPFNPSSTSQIVTRLNEAGWKPKDKTKGHIEALRKRDKIRIAKFKVSGWKVNEKNLSTLPKGAPQSAQTLSEYLLVSSRVSTLTEWINGYWAHGGDDGRIHGTFNPIGTWTHRMSHVKPNLGNPVAPRSLYGKEMRSLFKVREGHKLVGCDASGIQLRILAHYVNEEEFTHNIVDGDPHQANKEALGEHCKTRDVAKTFIYAWLLGAGFGKVAEILSCKMSEAKEAVENFLGKYTGLRYLKKVTIPKDAQRRYFEGVDGRKVVCDSEHLMLSGYLQNGEACVMKLATTLWMQDLRERGIRFCLVNFVHDEWQTEVEDIGGLPDIVGKAQVAAIKEAGELLSLNAPLDGEYKIGDNWCDTH